MCGLAERPGCLAGLSAGRSADVLAEKLASFPTVPVYESEDVRFSLRRVWTGSITNTVHAALIVLGKLPVLKIRLIPHKGETIDVIIDVFNSVLVDQPFCRHQGR